MHDFCGNQATNQFWGEQWCIYTSSWHIYCKQPGEYTPSNEGKAYTSLHYHNQPMTCIQPVTIDLYEC